MAARESLRSADSVSARTLESGMPNVKQFHRTIQQANMQFNILPGFRSSVLNGFEQRRTQRDNDRLQTTIDGQ